MSLRKFLPVPSMDQITFKVPDDWHLHLRDGTLLKFTTKCAVQQCQRALIMPNIRPPVTNTTQAMEYKARILESLPDGVPFEPMMAIYMTDQVNSPSSDPYIYDIVTIALVALVCVPACVFEFF